MRASSFYQRALIVLWLAWGASAAAAADLWVAPLDKSRHAQERKVMLAPNNRRSFPNLGAQFEVMSASSSEYNCIGHSLGTHNHWINPLTGPEDDPLSYMDRLYRLQGYVRLSTLNFTREAGKQKLVVYGTKRADGRIRAITHTAIQAADGSWQSKLGELPLIRHMTPGVLNGPSYGEPVAVFARKRN